MVLFNSDDIEGDKSTKVSHFDTLLASYKPCNDLASRIDVLKADDTCCFIYTSGTGGRPKAVMLTHRSIQSNVDAAAELLDEGQAKENARFLSLCHILMNIQLVCICHSRWDQRCGIVKALIKLRLI